MRSKIKRSLIISKSLPPCEAAEIRIFLPCIISEALPSAVKAGTLLTWQHLAAVLMSPSAAFHTCAPVLWAHRQLLPFNGTFVKHFPPVKVQTCLLSDIRGCHGDTARSTCSNDTFLLFLFLRGNGRRSDCFLPHPTPFCLETCCDAVDLLTVSFFFFFFSPQRPHQKIPGHWPGQAPWQHEGEWISLSDPDGSFPYFIPLVGHLLSKGLRLLMVPISPLQKFMDGSFGLSPQSAWQTSACGRVYLVRIKINISVF